MFLQTPAAGTELATVLEVTASIPGATAFKIDIDLNHDGRFSGLGELGYAEGRLDGGSARVLVHGLIAGRYQARARVNVRGHDVVSEVCALEVLPSVRPKLPISFEPNAGQAESGVLFLARTQDQTMFLAADEITVVTTLGPSSPRELCYSPGTSPAREVQRFRLLNANPWARPVGHKKLPGISNYFIGTDPNQWRTNIETYEEILTRGVYPGIDLIHYSRDGRFAYDFRIAPGADPSGITLDFPDVNRLSLDENGELLLELPGGAVMRKSAPLMYQESLGRREAVKGDWMLRGPRQAGYVITAYDRERELVIDPYLFSTYLGGAGNDSIASVVWGHPIAIDGAGNTYVVGSSTSVNFPTTPGVFQAASGGPPASAAVVFKLNPAGTALVFSTYLGGGGNGTFGNAIATDPGGNVYVAGHADAGFPVTPGAFQTVFGGLPSPGLANGDAFIAKLNPSGTALLYSTYLGGTGGDVAEAIVVDGAGNAYVGGTTGSSVTFPTTPGAVQPAPPGAPTLGFLTKLNPTGAALVYSTFVGGAQAAAGQRVLGVSLDASNNAYICGYTRSPSFPLTPGAFQSVVPGAP